MNLLIPGLLALMLAQQQSPPPANDPSSQKSQDVPHQQPGTNNPDIAPEHKPLPKKNARKKKQTDETSTRQAKQNPQ